jgi:hypothetical protein
MQSRCFLGPNFFRCCLRESDIGRVYCRSKAAEEQSDAGEDAQEDVSVAKRPGRRAKVDASSKMAPKDFQ